MLSFKKTMPQVKIHFVRVGIQVSKVMGLGLYLTTLNYPRFDWFNRLFFTVGSRVVGSSIM